MTLLEVDAVERSFGGIRALNGCSLGVAANSITGLIGPNGSGKTTLLNVVTGYVAAAAGEVRFGGDVITNASPERVFAAGIARTFQVSRVFPRLTVAENMQVPVGRRGRAILGAWSSDRELGRGLELIDFVGLRSLLRHPAGDLSHGQRKLLELAMVLRSEPRVVLLDEPASGINPTLLVELAARIRDLRERGTGFLIVEHDMEFVMGLCDRVVVMHQGKAIADDAPERIRANPAVIDAYLGGPDGDE